MPVRWRKRGRQRLIALRLAGCRQAALRVAVVVVVVVVVV